MKKKRGRMLDEEGHHGASGGDTEKKRGKRVAKDKGTNKRRKVAGVNLKERGVFMDNGNTEGGRVKMAREVINTYWSKVETDEGKRPKAPNVNCRVETLGAIISDFGAVERKWVVEMGFGGLLYLAGKRQPRMLCYWLMAKLDPVRQLLVINANCRYQLTPQSVHWVFGLPCGGKKIPTVAETEVSKEIVESVFEKYGSYTKEGYRKLPMKNVMPCVMKRHDSDDDSDEFKLAFLIFLLGEFMCPSACTMLSPRLLPALSVYDEAQDYDWCAFLLDNLMTAGRQFAQNFYQNGYAKGCGGCTYFLALFYMDHLDRELVSWGIFPRVKAWTNEHVNTVKHEDRLRDEDGKLIVHGDFGELGCIDVAYGEKHPYGGRDTMGPTTVYDEVAKAVMGALKIGSEPLVGRSSSDLGKGVEPEELLPSKVKRRHGPADKSNPRSRMAAKKDTTDVAKTAEVIVTSELKKAAEVIVEDCDTEQDTDEELVNGSPAFSPAVDQDCGEVLSKIVFSQDEMGAALNGEFAPIQSQNDSVFHRLFNELLGPDNAEQPIHHEMHPEDDDDLQETGDGSVVQGESVRVAKDEGGNNRDEGCAPSNSCENKCSEEVNDTNQGSETVPNNETNNETNNEVPDSAVGSACEGDGQTQKDERPRQLSRPKRGRRPSKTLNNKEFIVDPVPRCNPNSRSRLVRFILTTGALIADSYNCRGECLNNYEVNIPVIQCDGMYADVMNCYSVVSPYSSGVDDNFVRTAARLYTKKWKDKFEGRGLRYFMDPTFAMRLLQEKGPPLSWAKTKNLCSSYAKRFVDVDVDSLNVVFVPVLNKSHWWCVAVSVNTKSVWVIDSVGLRQGVREKLVLKKVLTGVGMFFEAITPAHNIGDTLAWPVKTVKMECQPDSNSCGVRMLLAIKACAERYVEEYVLRAPIEEEREWLLTDDVMDPLNEVKDQLRRKIDEHIENCS